MINLNEDINESFNPYNANIRSYFDQEPSIEFILMLEYVYNEFMVNAFDSNENDANFEMEFLEDEGDMNVERLDLNIEKSEPINHKRTQ